MCGRYHHGPMTEHYWEELRAFVNLLECERYIPRYNIAPTMNALILRLNDDRERIVTLSRWGLLPSWAKDKTLAYKTFNARCESIAEKPAFRSAFKRRRCFALATGYYEWQKLGPKEKQAYNIRLTDGRPMLFYGLWECWPGPKQEPLSEPLETFTVITTDANEATASIHDRMPCLTTWDSEQADVWLDSEFQDYDHLQSLLRPCAANELETIAISNYVNKVGNEGEKCIEPM